MKGLVRFLKAEEGATAMEYGLILGLAGLIAFAGIYAFYESLQNLFGRWAGWFDAPTEAGPVGAGGGAAS